MLSGWDGCFLLFHVAMVFNATAMLSSSCLLLSDLLPNLAFSSYIVSSEMGHKHLR